MQTATSSDIAQPINQLLSQYMGLLNPVHDTLENLYRLSFEEESGNLEWSSTISQSLRNMEVVLISMETIYASIQGRPPETLVLHAVQKHQVREDQWPEVLF